MKNLEKFLSSKSKDIHAIYVSSYIPRRCGLATFTKDLTNAVNLLNPHALAEIMAINRRGEKLKYPWEVKFKIDQDNLSTYLQAADYINQSAADVVSLQHEFGLFGGNCGEYVLQFVKLLKRPLITTLHTVVEDPTSDYGLVIKKLIQKSNLLIVMIEKIKEKLVTDYGVSAKKIVVIPHGIPDLPYNPTYSFKRKKKLSGKILLGNINLLSRVKGIEYVLEAVSLIVKKYPKLVYLIIGQTHPVVLQHQGEKYRNFLKDKVRKLGIETNVRFVNQYLPLGELIKWLKAIDIYVTPYLDPHQAASGALSYAIGAGKPCVSTPYLYAQEVLNNDRGVLVPFRDPKPIAKAITDLWENPRRRKKIEKRAYHYARLMTWPNVALQHLRLFRFILNQNGKKSLSALAMP